MTQQQYFEMVNNAVGELLCTAIMAAQSNGVCPEDARGAIETAVIGQCFALLRGERTPQAFEGVLGAQIRAAVSFHLFGNQVGTA